MELSAIILAAGAGTRMKSVKPKVAHEIMEKPLIRYVVDAARNAGADEVVSVVGFGREYVIPLVIDDTTVTVQEEQTGTAAAVYAARQAFKGKEGYVLVLSGDSPLITPETLKELVAAQQAEGAAAAVLTMTADNPFGYGRIIFNEAGEFERIVEEKDATDEQRKIKECNSGFYCFEVQKLFKALYQVSSDNAQGEYYLTDVIQILREQGDKVMAFHTDNTDECRGINSRTQLADASKIMQRRINEYHMANGVTMYDPDLVWVGQDVEIEPDVELLPMTFVLGKSRVGSGTIIGPNSRVKNSTIGRNCTIDETVVIWSTVEDEVTCGPRAYLRPDAYMCKGSKAGSHVEIKKSIIGEGTKVPHLSYIGDATLGKNVNIGAGSVTCNYDGTSKWATHIGDDSFIGSSTMMVAPVRIGKDVTVGAGSVITKDVPDHALALGRARQVEIPDWKEHQAKKRAAQMNMMDM